MEYSKDVIEQWNIEGKRHVTTLISDIKDLIKTESIRILDVGSNIGKFTELLSEHVIIEDAIFVEPVLELLEYSQEKFPQYTFINAAISNSSEPLHLYVPPSDNLGVSRVLEHWQDDDPFIRMIPSLKLSHILLKMYPDFHPDLIKIDAEGLDTQIVEELINYIHVTNKKPFIIFEVDGTADISVIVELYSSLGYTVRSNGDEGCSRDIFLLP